MYTPPLFLKWAAATTTTTTAAVSGSSICELRREGINGLQQVVRPLEKRYNSRTEEVRTTWSLLGKRFCFARRSEEGEKKPAWWSRTFATSGTVSERGRGNVRRQHSLAQKGWSNDYRLYKFYKRPKWCQSTISSGARVSVWVRPFLERVSSLWVRCCKRPTRINGIFGFSHVQQEFERHAKKIKNIWSQASWNTCQRFSYNTCARNFCNHISSCCLRTLTLHYCVELDVPCMYDICEVLTACA